MLPGTAPALLLLLVGGLAVAVAPYVAAAVRAPCSVVIGVVVVLVVLLVVCVGSRGRMWWLVGWVGVARVYRNWLWPNLVSCQMLCVEGSEAPAVVMVCARGEV